MRDRAFYKKVAKAQSKSELEGCARPCLLQKSVKGTVETGAKSSSPTVPFIKKRQRHGQNREADGTTDRAFCKKAAKARSKPELESRALPCLLQKSAKGTVETGAKRSSPTVPFAKKVAKARSKSELEGRARPCLLEKMSKSTVKIGAKQPSPTVPFAKKVAKALSKP